MGAIAGAWGEGLGRWAGGVAPWAIALVAAAVLALVAIVRWRLAPLVAVAVLLIVLLYAGAQAAGTGEFRQLGQEQDLRTLVYTQAVSLEENAPLTIAAQVVPAWRQHAGVTGAIVVPALGLVALGLSLTVRWRPLRALLAAGGLSAWVYAAALFPATHVYIGHLFTWGLPTLVLVVVLGAAVASAMRRASAAADRDAAGPVPPEGPPDGPPANPPTPPTPPTPPAPPAPPGGPSPAGAAAALVLGLALWQLVGCAATPTSGPLPISNQAVIERLECQLSAEKDSLSADVHVKVSTPEPCRIALLDSTAVRLSPDPAGDVLRLREEDGKHYLHVRKKGVYELDLKFLVPLPAAADDGTRRFSLSLPTALTNRVELSVPQTNLDLVAPGAIRFTREESGTATIGRAIFGPGEAAAFAWRPRARQTALEKTVFYADLTSVLRFDTGVVEGRHALRLQIAQGELKDLRIAVPDKLVVTAVEGPGLGAWRFDPATREVEAHLLRPVSGEYVLRVVTQLSSEQMPYAATLGGLVVKDALRQRGILGVVASPSVYVTVGEHPPVMNVDDFARDAAALLAGMAGAPASAGEPANKTAPAPAAPGMDLVRYAYRLEQPGDKLTAQVAEVKPEIRSSENARFVVVDDRLVYNAEFAVEIAKAGVFSIDLSLPEGYDIDTLDAPEISHWDELAPAAGIPAPGNPAAGSAAAVGGPGRIVQLHFRRKVLGTVAVKLALSRPISELPKTLAVPRVEVAPGMGALKHTGQVVVVSDRSVRLSVAARDGVSEFNPVEVNERTLGALAFRLLRPQWSLTLQTEVVEPRLTVDFVHVARVAEGMVRHSHHLRYQLYHAGAKVFDVDVPRGALGLLITGKNIVRVTPAAPDSGAAGSGGAGVASPFVRYVVELSGKWYDTDGPYNLTVTYEMPMGHDGSLAVIRPVQAAKVDLQRGYVAVFASERVELRPGQVSASLQPTEARAVPRDAAAGDLSAAAFCYFSPDADYQLEVTAKRHEAAVTLDAVQSARLETVVTEKGQTISRMELRLRPGQRKQLRMFLPPGAEIWSLLVDGRATPPSLEPAAAGGKGAGAATPGAATPGAATPGATQPARSVVLIPLAEAAASEEVSIEFVYVQPSPPGFDPARQSYDGPQFDLPLQDLKWTFYVPEGFEYDRFDGTLTVDEKVLEARTVEHYTLATYRQAVAKSNENDRMQAAAFEGKASEAAKVGRNLEANTFLNSAWSYSLSDPSLNEDIRVKLQEYNTTNTMVGLAGNRTRLRLLGNNGADPATAEALAQETTRSIGAAAAARVRSGLNKADSDNLQMIAERVVQTQEKAAGAALHLVINMPLHGRVLEFDRPLQTQPQAPMTVSFEGRRPLLTKKGGAGLWAGGVGAGLFLLLWLGPALRRRWRALRANLEANLAAKQAEGAGGEGGAVEG